MSSFFEKFIYSLPVQLLFHHIKRNLALVLLWMFFLAAFLGGIGRIYGIHYLFLDPEYLNKVSFLSYFWVGLALGNYIMAFHITSYILDGHRFPFIGILEKPFAKYTVNNSVIPALALMVYIIAIIHFHMNNEFTAGLDILIYLFGLLVGVLSMILLMFLYFKFTNKDIFRYLAGSVDKTLRKSQISRERVMIKLKESKKRARVDYYLDLKLRLRTCKKLTDFHDKESVLKVFDQNHFNSVILEVIIILLVLILGIFLERPWAQIPAAASSLLLFSMVIMLIGAISYWFRSWGVAFVFGLFILANFITKTGVLGKYHPVRGVNYDTVKADYSLDNLKAIASKENYDRDKEGMLHALTHWKEKFDVEKPKLILMCVSGGGQRAALWTVNALQHIDKRLDQPLMEKAFLLTGASGGMIGAAYYREVYRQFRDENDSINYLSDELLQNMGKDNLNAIIFSLVVNDTFFKLRKFTYEGRSYLKDRGYVFEKNLNNNLGGILDKPISFYTPLEIEAKLPVMLLSPVVSNDGRKLYISSSPVSFMTISSEHEKANESIKIRGVDFNRLFQDQDALSLNFLSALRMSASFPYITPTVSLPSNPRIEVMDAGIADNFGINDALRFMFVFKDWIEKNTSGVVMIVIRDTRKVTPVEEKSNPSIIDRFTNPISSVYNNLGNIQDIRNDSQIENAAVWLNAPFDVVALEYDTYTLLEEMQFTSEFQKRQRKEQERASLSWHLTAREKKNIIENINTTGNQNSLYKIDSLLNSKSSLTP